MSSTSPEHEDVMTLETREAPPTHFLMKVESFSLLGEIEIQKYESGEFEVGGHKWRLILDTNEDKTGKESKYISLYLAITDKTSSEPANWEVNAVFSIFLLNQISGNYHYSLGRTRRFQAMKLEWGFPKFISKEILMDPSKGFLIKDNCVFGAEVFIVEKLAVSECLSVKNVCVPHMRDWKISNFSELERCWTSDKFVVDGLNWNILLYPKGSIQEKDRSQAIGIFLQLIDSKRVKASLCICIKDQISNKHEKLASDSIWFSPTSKTWGLPRLMEVSTLEDSRNGFIVGDCCHLEIELTVDAVV